ncbi:hypothetical protein KR059_012940, partial [Drosophila kikkawai]
TDLEKRAVKVHVAKVTPEDILERFSTLDKALRVLAYVKRFIQRSRKLMSSVEDHLTDSEIVSAERLLISVTQRRHFVLEMGCLRQKRPVPTSKFLHALKEAVTGAYSQQQLLWQFIPPGAPHMGGLWKAGVKSFKTLFYKSTATRKYTFEELSTLLARIEACLNSRPLASMSEDPADLLAVTPGHFLVEGPLLAVVEPEIKGVTTSIINRWQHQKTLHQHFRLRWKEEYLKELHKRNKWRAPTRNLRAGDMLVVKEDNLPSNEWRLGRIDVSRSRWPCPCDQHPYCAGTHQASHCEGRPASDGG